MPERQVISLYPPINFIIRSFGGILLGVEPPVIGPAQITSHWDGVMYKVRRGGWVHGWENLKWMSQNQVKQSAS